MVVIGMKYTAKNLTTSAVRKEANKYNKLVKRLMSKSQDYLSLETYSVKDILTGRTDAEIAKELNRLQNLAKKDQQELVNYNEEYGVKVPRFVLESIEKDVARANKLKDKLIAGKISREAGNIGIIESENLKDITMGTGDGITAIRRRAKTARNRARQKYLEEKGKLYKQNYIRTCRNELGIFASTVISAIENIDGNILFRASLDPHYGDDLTISYVYSPEKAEDKVSTILNALEKVGLYVYG